MPQSVIHAVYIEPPCKLNHRYREQARSHKGLAVGMDGVSTPDQGGSGLAREDDITFDIDAS
ncbi:hypothetical protein [Pseudomonas corrugata]|uniref:hypothetical protein n=1 Tax=Pseudomonas corrugata TaxID=47879 RepID=UPI0004677BBB|nr:hypothetical protein [Pseudomonas corrugata]